VVKGTHTIKFGAAVERMQLEINALVDPNENFRFSRSANLLRQPAQSVHIGYSQHHLAAQPFARLS